MKLRIRLLKLSVLIVFSVSVLENLPAQNFAETIKFADDQCLSGNLTSSINAYQRALFFSDGKDNLYLFSQIAELSFLKMDYETSQTYFGLACNQSDNDSVKTELLFKKAYCQILNKNYQFAIIDLLSVSDTSKQTKRRLNFYLATCYFGLEDYKNAELYFGYCIDISKKKELSDLFSNKKIFSPSPKKARILSMIIPGLGQTYSGDLKSGINSLLLTSGLIALGINISIKYHPFDAIFSIFPWYQRYYTGGYGKAEEIASKRRQSKRNEVYTTIVKTLAEN
jgi:tetratricopeptide (TPR) repeat protein